MRDAPRALRISAPTRQVRGDNACQTRADVSTELTPRDGHDKLPPDQAVLDVRR